MPKEILDYPEKSKKEPKKVEEKLLTFHVVFSLICIPLWYMITSSFFDTLDGLFLNNWGAYQDPGFPILDFTYLIAFFILSFYIVSTSLYSFREWSIINIPNKLYQNTFAQGFENGCFVLFMIIALFFLFSLMVVLTFQGLKFILLFCGLIVSFFFSFSFEEMGLVLNYIAGLITGIIYFYTQYHVFVRRLKQKDEFGLFHLSIFSFTAWEIMKR